MEVFLTKRLASGIICALLLVAIMFLTNMWPFALNIAVAIVSFCSINELLILKKEDKFSIFFLISSLFSTVRPLVGPGTYWQASVYFYTMACFIISMLRFIKNKKKTPPEQKSVWNVCFIFFLNIIISVSLGTIVEIRNFGNKFGVFFPLLTLGMAWSCDIGAYIFGKFFGKNKLCPYVSPKKTIEGAIGGLSLSVFYSLTFSYTWQFFFKIQKIDYTNIFIMAIFGAPIAILGDLCFSLIKRMLSVKDFGDIIPGHGGVLDRFDSVIFVSPFVFIFLHIFNIVGEL